MRHVAAAAFAAVAVLAACTSGGDPKPSASPSPSPTPDIQGIQVITGLSHDHVQGDVTYDQTPPAGGKHNAVWLKCGVYDEVVPEENAVHAMEHGGVWITHDPAMTGDALTTLNRLQALNPEYVLISPFPGLPSKVVVSTWGYQLAVDSVSDPRLKAFVEEFAGGGQGGEKGAPCARGGATLEEIRQGG